MVATYRLQLGPHVDFAAARSLVPYLRDLGVSHLYLSPCLQARGRSTHGYDVVDPTRISAELGGEKEFRRLCAAAPAVILDIVPNHMAADEANPFWPDPRFFDLDPATGRHRRFFDIDELAGVRQEDPEVFEATHAKVLELVADGVVQGLRVDHPDGLADPAGYLRRLRERGAAQVWVEKILEPGERLRDWPVEGTTGYDFLNDAQALFVDPAGEEPLTELYAELTGDRRAFDEIAFEAKLEQALTTFRPELERLRRLLDLQELEEATAAVHVYRTYVEPWSGKVDERDRDALAALPERLRRVMLLEERGHDEFVTRFQQTTGAVTAKGVEDTAFYRYVRLLALNEVGGNPGRFGLPVTQFHEGALERARRFPRTLLAATTHDTKRSADVRARIAALASCADEWRRRILRWRDLNGALRARGAPDANEEYLVYQTLVGAWPLEPERLEAYVEKALREAKVNTSWVDPKLEWEGAVKRFCRALYDHAAFRADFEPFAADVARTGAVLSLRQLLLRLTSPGVPDIYQGDELEALLLVDPDNRRAVDWERRRRELADPRPGTKLDMIRRVLALRAERPDAFDRSYEPVEAGPRVCAYRRGPDVLVVVPVAAGWEEARLEDAVGHWRDVVTGEEVRLGARAAARTAVRAAAGALLVRRRARFGAVGARARASRPSRAARRSRVLARLDVRGAGGRRPTTEEARSGRFQSPRSETRRLRENLAMRRPTAVQQRARPAGGPVLRGSQISFTFAEPRRALARVRLAHELHRPRLVDFSRPPRARTWTLDFPRPDADRMEYQLELTRRDGRTELLCDPANPLRALGPFGEKSVLEFPGYRPPAWLAADAPPGELETVAIRSRILRTTLEVPIWTATGGAAGEPLPLLVVHDGPEFAAYSSLLEFLDAAWAEGDVPTMRAALFPPPGDRNQSYSGSAVYARALVRELLPALADAAPTPSDRDSRVGVGASLGALAILHAHRLYPQTFGGLFLQSGSFFRRRFDPQEAGFVRFARINRVVGDLLAGRGWVEPIPVRLTCGTVEENLANNRSVERALRAQGYDVELAEVRDAHNWVAWRDAFEPQLTALLQRVWQ